jgi:hypothetical protein
MTSTHNVCSFHLLGCLLLTPPISETLIDLTNETRSRLHEIGDKLRVLWVAAQQVNARQKVEVSIR